MAAVCHGANGPTVSCLEAGGWPDARIHDTGNRCILARSFVSFRENGAGIVGGAAELPSIGANLAREAVAILGFNAAVATELIAFGMTRGVRLANNQTILALNEGGAVCRGRRGSLKERQARDDDDDAGRGLAVGDEASEENDGVAAEEHADIRIRRGKEFSDRSSRLS